jgi:hypothetical protein
MKADEGRHLVQLSLPKNSTVTEGKIFIAASGASRVKTFCVYRWSPDDDSDLHTDITKWISIRAVDAGQNVPGRIRA